jgi:hypothetical protein
MRHLVDRPASGPMAVGIQIQAARKNTSETPQGAAESVRRCPWIANELGEALSMVTSWARRFGDRLSLSGLHPNMNPCKHRPEGGTTNEHEESRVAR